MLQTKFHEAHESPEATSPAALHDLRFRSLLSKEDWSALPPPIQRRFTRHIADGKAAIYAGKVEETRLSIAGWAFAQIARVIGGPLPLSSDAHAPSVVSVTEDAARGGQIWTRIYARKHGFPQVIHSAKRFVGTTGLEEHVGGGVGMELTVHQERGALVFRSARYFFRAGPLRLTLPVWLTPGALTVTHAEEGGGRFSFLLEIVHPFFGPVVRQFARFQEVTP